MALLFSQLFAPTVMTTSAATLYTVPSSPASSLLKNGRMRFTNTDTASHSITAYAIQSGGTATAANCFANAETIAPNSHLDIDVPALAAGGFLQAKADAATSVTAFALDGVVFS